MRLLPHQVGHLTRAVVHTYDAYEVKAPPRREIRRHMRAIPREEAKPVLKELREWRKTERQENRAIIGWTFLSAFVIGPFAIFVYAALSAFFYQPPLDLEQADALMHHGRSKPSLNDARISR